MMLISNLAEAHLSSIAAARQATLQDISKANLDCHASWFTIFKMHNTITEIVVFHCCTLLYSCWICDILVLLMLL